MKQYTKPLIIFLLPFLLSGCLPTIFTGTAGSVMELAKDRKVGDTLTDVRISTAIKGEFVKKNFRCLYSKIKIEVVQGRVLFTGVISKEEDAVTAVQIAWNQEGVTEVINELKLDKNNGNFDLVQYTRDTLITSQIKSSIFMNRDIKFVNYTVITINDIVYLFGLARSEEELERVANIASNVNRVKKVISHVRVQKLARKVKTTAGDSETPAANGEKDPGSEFLIDQGDDLNLNEGIGGDW
ncbi:BON domain-containing protein [Rickettsiaceae bacterium]|nr:BON domain-containing protein [Rickettsiaceae bacterium]